MTAATSIEAEARAAWRLPYAMTPYDVWTRTNVGEVFPNVVTPFTWSMYGRLADRLLNDPERLAFIPKDLFEDGRAPLLFRAINGRLWYNVGLTHYIATERFGMPSWFYSLTLGGPWETERLRLGERGLRPLRLAAAAPRLLREQRRQQSVIARFRREAATMRAETRALAKQSLDALDVSALVKRLDHIVDRAVWPYMELLDGSGAALNAYGTLAWLCQRWCGDRALANDLVTGLANLLTAQASVELWQVALAARDNYSARRIIEAAPPNDLRRLLAQDSAATPVTTALNRFFSIHGHRAADEFELSVPRWSEDTTFVQSVLRSYLEAAPEMNPLRHLDRQRERRNAAERRTRRMLTRGTGRLVPWRWLVFRTILKQTRHLLPLRENPKYHFLLYAAEMRRTALALGRALAERGLIDAVDDVFFLMRPELERAAAGSLADLRPYVAAHRALHMRFVAWQPPDVVLGADVGEAEAEAQRGDIAVSAAAPINGRNGGGRLTGIAASAGVVTGRARVALTPDEGADLEPGEVLIAPFTDPGWTPLFTVAGAIVMDLGGLLSHGAIVAREYGIPAVVNTRHATTRVRSGQQVTVNGDTGEVAWEE